MRKTAVLWIALLALAAAMLLPVRGPATPTPREPHPEIRAAMQALQNAKMHLQKADRDFQGHRSRAVQLTDQALQECREALRADRN